MNLRSTFGLALCLLPLGASSAGALPQPVATGEVTNVVADGQYVYYGPAKVLDVNPETQRILRFDRLSGSTLQIYEAPPGWSITSVFARNGVVAFKIEDDPTDDIGTAKVLTINPDGSGLREVTSLVSSAVPTSTSACYDYLGIVGITESGALVTSSIMFRPTVGTACAKPQVTMSVDQTAPGAPTQNISTIQSPVYLTKRSQTEARAFYFILRHFPAQVTDAWIVRNFFTARGAWLSVGNRTSVQTFRTRIDAFIDSVQPWPSGMMFYSTSNDDGYRHAYVKPIAQDVKPKELRRRHADSEFHACGDVILENYSSLSKRGRLGKREHLAIRSQTGYVASELAQTLPRGSDFRSCDAGAAVFTSYPVHKRAQTFVVAL